MRSRARDPRAVTPARSDPPTTTTTAPPRREKSFDTAPAPPILDRGRDHVAIARSLVAYGRWLEWHHPDPTLVEHAYARGSAIARGMAKEVMQAKREHKRVIEVDVAPYDYVVLSERQNVVSFRVTEHLARRDLVDTHGRVLRHTGPRTEQYVISIMRFTPDAPWRLDLVHPQGPPAEVQLSSATGSGELDGGRLGVGIDTAGRGLSVPIDSYSPSLPRLVHYVSIPLPGGRPGDLGNLCNASGQASNATALVAFGWLYDVIAYSLDGRVISDTHVCVAFPDPTNTSAPPPAPVLPVAPTIGDVWRAVALPRPVVGVNPVRRGVTGLDTRLWSGGGQTAQVAINAGGFRITGTARVIEYRFSTDEGYIGSSTGPGDESGPVAAHRFARKGAHSLSVASVWQANVTMTAIGAGPGGALAVPIDIDTAVLTATVNYPVVEVRSRLVA